ncbi:hypothetical protein C2E23DRAFT_428489 [Lenzites betulinus]|nr:hypothetical protein C2E23DRAFT_428489 [Lenzites betulinus]
MMPSLRATLALVILAESIICGATPVTHNLAPASELLPLLVPVTTKSPAMVITHTNVTFPSEVASSESQLAPRRDPVSIANSLIACTNDDCNLKAESCTQVHLDGIPKDLCELIDAGQSFNSILVTGKLTTPGQLNVGRVGCTILEPVPLSQCFTIPDGLGVSVFKFI